MLVQRLGLHARPTAAWRTAARASRLYATTRPLPSAHDQPVRGQEPPLPTEATPQDPTVPPMYPNAPSVRGEQPPLPTDEDSPSAIPTTPRPAFGGVPPAPRSLEAAPVNPAIADPVAHPTLIPARPVPQAMPAAHDATWGQESPFPTPATAQQTSYPITPPQPPRGQEPPLPGEAVQAPFTAPPVAPVRQEPPPPPPRVEPVYQPPPPPPKKRTFASELHLAMYVLIAELFLTFVLGGVLGAAYVPWYRSVQQDTRALEAILIERERVRQFKAAALRTRTNARPVKSTSRGGTSTGSTYSSRTRRHQNVSSDRVNTEIMHRTGSSDAFSGAPL
ncbi:unnamed protein product [Cutaneotrichosporon oleaginosum]